MNKKLFLYIIKTIFEIENWLKTQHSTIWGSWLYVNSLSLKSIYFIDKIKLILYPKIRNSMTQLTLLIINKFKPVRQSTQKELRAYYPKIYILCLESVQYVRGSATVVCEVVCTSAGAVLFVAVYMFSWDVFKDWIVLQPIFVIKNSWKATFGTNARTRPGRAFAEVAAVWRIFFPGARKPLLSATYLQQRTQWLKVPQKSVST